MSSQDRTERVVHIIDSKHRSSGTNEDFEVKLDKTLTRVSKAEIVSIEIPFAFYVVNTNNNIIDFDNNAAAPLQAVIPVGNYSGTSFAAEIQTQMNALYPGFTVTYDVTIYKLVFTHATNFNLKSSGTMSALIGLLADSGITNSFTCQGITNLSGPNYILIRSDRLTRPLRRKPLIEGKANDILYKMPVQTGPGTTLVEKNLFANPYKFAVRQSLSTIDFRIEDVDGNTLDLNGQRWSMTIVYNIL